jgi:hypothetical protein
MATSPPPSSREDDGFAVDRISLGDAADAPFAARNPPTGRPFPWYHGRVAAPWAYPDETSVDDTGPSPVPTWDCPGGLCVCHGQALDDDHRIFLFDRLGYAMPGARCRVLVGRRALNRAMPYADARGSVIFRLPGPEARVLVEWAPPSMPNEPVYPYRIRYAPARLTDNHGHREDVRRRLANLGFARCSSLDENVEEFQRACGRPVTCRWQDLAHELAIAHDGGLLQPFVDPPNYGDAFEPHPSTSPASPSARRLGVMEGHEPDHDAGRGDEPPAIPPPPPSPSAGSVCQPGLASIRFELIIATPLRPFKSELLTRVGGARVLLDGSQLTPPVPPTTHVAGSDGKLCINLPASTGPLVIDVMPPERWSNASEIPASPDLTNASRLLGETALAAVPKRKALFDARRASEARIVELEADLTMAGLELEKARETTDTSAIAAALKNVIEPETRSRRSLPLEKSTARRSTLSRTTQTWPTRRRSPSSCFGPFAFSCFSTRRGAS